MFFFKNHAKDDAGRLDLLLFFKKSFTYVKASDQHRSFNIVW